MGYFLAKSRSLERVLSPYLVASQAIPVVAIAPLLVIWLGDGILSKVVICALIVFFPVLVNTIVGVRAVPTALYDLMNSLHASRSQILWKVEVPASLPVFLGGLRMGATLSVIGAIVGELVDAEKGLGFLLQLGDFQYDTPMVFVAVFTLDRPGIDVVWNCDIAGKKIFEMAGKITLESGSLLLILLKQPACRQMNKEILCFESSFAHAWDGARSFGLCQLQSHE